MKLAPHFSAAYRYVDRCLTGLTVSAAYAETAPVTIGTHDGNFHCDEALACALLRSTRQFAEASIIRTRNPEILERCTTVVDVGAVYDPARLRYDHHQMSFQGTMETEKKKYHTRLSSAGLVYKHYGPEIIRGYMEELKADETSDKIVNLVFDRLYQGFVEHIDAIDNGINEYAPETPGGKIKHNYNNTTSLSSRVGALYPPWNVPHTRAQEDEQFAAAVQLAGTEFFEKLHHYVASWVPARSVVEKAFVERKEHHASGKIMCLESGGCPWKEHLFDIESESKCEGEILFILFPDGKSGWRVMAVSKEPGSFENRMSLLWKGTRGDELVAASGIEGGIFVHAAGFIGGNETFEGALRMAVETISNPK